jgi:transketolase
MAMAARRERGLLDPDAAPGTSTFDHFIYCFVSDGDIEEGISHEVSSLAGHHRLGNLIVLYDDNQISIEDNTTIAKSEDVCARYEAYGWHVQKVSWRAPGGYREDVPALYQAFLTAREHTEAPSFIALSTIIGWPAPDKQDTGAAHGSALGVPEVKATKEILRFDPEVDFPVEDEALNRARQVAERGKKLHAEWEAPFAAWASANPGRKALFDRLAARRLPDGWTAKLRLPVLDRSQLAGAEGAARGGYVLAEGGDVILIATGSEVLIALAAREQLAAGGVSARVVSMPCVEWFRDQVESYRDEVLPPAIRARVSVEAGITAPWCLFTGEAGASIGVDHFGASADYKTLYQEFGITAERVAAAARDSLARA